MRQGCILSPLLFNLYLDEFPRLIEPSRDTDSITLPNGLPVNCLFYADDLILISRSAAGLQKQINILHNYSEKWLLKINLKKTKTLIFQKQNRKSTRDKFSFFLNGTPMIRPHSTVTLALISAQMVVLLIPKKLWLKKPEDQYLLLNVILTLINYLSIHVINYLILYFFPFFYTGLKFGELMIT